jgi:hypothetical protein
VTIENLASGLIGALVGAVVTIAWLQWERRQRLRAAGRAVLVELARDSVVVDSLLDDLAGVDWAMTASTYNAVLPELAALLKLADLSIVSQPYLAIEAAEDIRISLSPGVMLSSDQRERIEELKQLLARARKALGPYIAERDRLARLHRLRK